MPLPNLHPCGVIQELSFVLRHRRKGCARKHRVHARPRHLHVPARRFTPMTAPSPREIEVRGTMQTRLHGRCWPMIRESASSHATDDSGSKEDQELPHRDPLRGLAARARRKYGCGSTRRIPAWPRLPSVKRSTSSCVGDGSMAFGKPSTSARSCSDTRRGERGASGAKSTGNTSRG
jgi:hypothetical protein